VELGSTISAILSAYGLDAEQFSIHRINSGHINYTFKVEPGYVLQRINKNVFLDPLILAKNLQRASAELKRKAPDYLFLNVIQSLKGEDLVFDEEGYPWRLFPYIEDTVTINEVDNSRQAFAAAKAFGRLSRLLSESKINEFKETIPRFHDLTLRYEHFEHALEKASAERIEKSHDLCLGYKRFSYLVTKYQELIASNHMQLRITHNDTKINNVLFKKNTDEVVCVIDLDTLMPGYFIYDLGDMVRTFVSPASEEETDVTKIEVRSAIYQSILDGYLSEMKDVLSPEEQAAIPLAGLMMTFMIGLRFLTDYLNEDVYYQTAYLDQNLNRAANQFYLLEKLASHTNL